MKILVTGGAGFIGSHIVDCLVDADYEVVVIDNLSSGSKEFVNKKALLYVRDITNDVTDIFEKERPDVVIHAAAQVMLRKSIEEPAFDAETNIIGTIRVLEGCRKSGVKRIVYTSTGGARYGEPEYLPVDEKHRLSPSSPYGISKYTAEQYIRVYSALYGIGYLIFCFGNVYGPRDDPRFGRVIAVFSSAMLRNTEPLIFGDGEQTRDFVYVKDLAQFITDSMLKNPKSKIFNLANGEQVSVNSVFGELKALSGFDKDPKMVAAIKGEVRDIVLDTALARSELGWAPKTTLKAGLRETYDYFRQKSKNPNII
jgi:UDP-glucose 4-epimerase